MSSNLFDKDGLEGDQHEQGEDAVVPVLVQAPQAHAEDLEHKERSRGPLLEELPKVWQSHIQPARQREKKGGRASLLDCWEFTLAVGHTHTHMHARTRAHMHTHTHACTHTQIFMD